MEIRRPQPPPPAPPLVPDYERPAAGRPAPGWAPRLLFQTVRPGRYVSDLVMVAGLVGILVLAMSVVGKLTTTFADFHLKLRPVTQALFDVHDVYDRYYGWALVWVVPLVAPLVLAQASPRWRRRWFVIGYVLIGLLIVAMFLALVIPLTELIEGISRQSAGGS